MKKLINFADHSIRLKHIIGIGAVHLDTDYVYFDIVYKSKKKLKLLRFIADTEKYEETVDFDMLLLDMKFIKNHIESFINGTGGNLSPFLLGNIDPHSELYSGYDSKTMEIGIFEIDQTSKTDINFIL